MRHTISLPDAMSRYVDAQVSNGMYGNVSEYFRDLVHRDQGAKHRTFAELREMLDRAERSGVSSPSMAELVESARADAGRRGLSSE